jgi:conjugative relaxase-like TrwC/TraI family protein
MLTVSKGAGKKKMQQYFREHYKTGDYYTEGRATTGEWWGHGAHALGLHGEVHEDEFSAALDGKDPLTGEQLVSANGKGERRAAFDATLNPPKSLSIQGLIADERLEAAHTKAVDAALNSLEGYAKTRAGHAGREHVDTNNLTIARFDHSTSRVGDPHLHTHAIVANMTQRDDGKWRALDARDMFRAQKEVGAVYRAVLEKEVKALGYETVKTRDGWELKGYSREQIEAFSQRREQITTHMRERGQEGGKAAQFAAWQTRKEKEPRNEQTLRREWQEKAKGVGLDLEGMTRTAKERSQRHEKTQSRSQVYNRTPHQDQGQQRDRGQP